MPKTRASRRVDLSGAMNAATPVERLIARVSASGFDMPDDATVHVDSYGDSAEMSAELLALIREGRKRAGTALLWAHDHDAEPVPQAGDLAIVVDHRDEPVFVARFLSVTTQPFDAVDAGFAELEGEGDRSLEFWRRTHWEFFTRECARIGREPAPEMPVVCSVFEVLHVLPTPGSV